MHPFVLAALLIFIFQVFSLNVPGLNGDEATNMLILDLPRFGVNLDKLGYIGPINFVLITLPYLVTSYIPAIRVGAWMIRLTPTLMAGLGAYLLYRELEHWSKSWARWTLLIFALHPMVTIYSRTAFPHSFFLLTFSMLMTEILRLQRTGEFRWLRAGFLLGFSTELHTTAFAGFAAVFLPVLGPLLAKARRQPGRVAGAFALFLLVSASVLRNFPPPVGAPVEHGGSIALEIRNFASMVDGHLPMHWLMHWDVIPDALLVLLLLALVYTFVMRVRELAASKDPRDRLVLRIWGSYLAVSFLMAILCYRGRTLTLIGHERYFLALVPGWMLLWGDAFMRYEARERWVGGALFGIYFTMLAAPTITYLRQDDPARLATERLMKDCPSDQCVVQAESFWNYWPMRYYSRDRLELNIVHPSWRKEENHELHGRGMTTCYLYEEPGDLADLASIHSSRKPEILIPPQCAVQGEACYRMIPNMGQ